MVSLKYPLYLLILYNKNNSNKQTKNMKLIHNPYYKCSHANSNRLSLIITIRLSYQVNNQSKVYSQFPFDHLH